jgi:hypothetical protein
MSVIDFYIRLEDINKFFDYPHKSNINIDNEIKIYN